MSATLFITLLVFLILFLRFGLGIGKSTEVKVIAPTPSTTPTGQTPTTHPVQASAPIPASPATTWWSWNTAIVILLVAVLLGFLYLYLGWRASVEDRREPAAAQKYQPQVRVSQKLTLTFEKRLRFVSGEKISRPENAILFQGAGGFANLEVDNLPKKAGIQYWIILSVYWENGGNLLLSINGGPPICLRHLPSGATENKVFASENFGEQYFRRGRNSFKLWTSGGKAKISSASIEAEWTE